MRTYKIVFDDYSVQEFLYRKKEEVMLRKTKGGSWK